MSNSLKPKDLLERLKGKIPVDEVTAKGFLGDLFDLLESEIKNEGRISLFGFGSFSTVPVKGSIRVNPRSGEPIVIPEHLRMKFSPASALAERVNKEYAHLEPVILEEEHPGLLVKASRYRDTLPREEPKIPVPEASGPPRKETPTETSGALVEKEPAEALPVTPLEQKALNEPEKKNGRRRVLFAIKILGALLVVFSLLLILIPRNSEKKERGKTQAALEKPEQAEPLEPASPPEKITEPQDSSPMAYKVTPGDTFSRLAQRYWGDIDLWPYLWDTNSRSFPDPDFLRPGDCILIPPKPEEEKQRKEIESSILSAYQRYRTLMEQQEDHPRNRYRILNVRKVLSGGQELYPDFVQRHRESIKPEDLPLP
ncbi:MAG: HU family DNA-binding protein [Spirochaetales bacterium]|nr:HU family DNA-binding protein [Spirochaetales bacterium]